MKMHSTHCIAWRCYRTQELAFYAAIPFALAFTGFALYGLERMAVVMAIMGSLAIGVSAGAWIIGHQFRE